MFCISLAPEELGRPGTARVCSDFSCWQPATHCGGWALHLELGMRKNMKGDKDLQIGATCAV